MDSIENLIATQQFTEASLFSVLFNLLLCTLLLSLVSWFYKRYSRSLGGKDHVGSVLPLIGLTVFMVITVVKSSLALSLGLVGALSIVRFRTPIKEPEELGYLFLTIAIGLGFGAGFNLVTIAITLFVLIYIFLTGKSKIRSNTNGEYTLVLRLPEISFESASQIINSQVISSKVIRAESSNDVLTTYLNISISDEFSLQNLLNELHRSDKSIELDLIESGVNW